VEQSFLGLKEASSGGDQYSQRKLRFELDLQDDVLTKASSMLGRMKTLSTFARRAGSVSQSDVWEGRIEELESIIATSGKKAAAAYAKSFYSGRSGLSSQHVIDLNKRARQCYRASRRNRASSSESISSSDSDGRKRRGKSRSRRMVKTAFKPTKVSCFTCGIVGHVSSSCQSKKRPPQPRALSSFAKKCHICEDPSHLARSCPLRSTNKNG